MTKYTVKILIFVADRNQINNQKNQVKPSSENARDDAYAQLVREEISYTQSI